MARTTSKIRTLMYASVLVAGSGLVLLYVVALLQQRLGCEPEPGPSARPLTEFQFSQEDKFIFKHLHTAVTLETMKRSWYPPFRRKVVGRRVFVLDCPVGYEGASMKRIREFEHLTHEAAACRREAIEKLEKLTEKDVPDPQVMTPRPMDREHDYGSVHQNMDETVEREFWRACRKKLEAEPKVVSGAKRYVVGRLRTAAYWDRKICERNGWLR